MKKWTDNLNTDVYERLANCTTIKSDILPLAQARWKWLDSQYPDKGFVSEDALTYVLELLDCNSVKVDLTRDEYYDIIAQI